MEIPQIKETKPKIDKQELYDKAIEKWGCANQLRMLIEECSELIQAIAHHERGRNGAGDVAEEIADVEILIEQAKQSMYLEDEVNEFKQQKLERLQKRVNEFKQQK